MEITSRPDIVLNYWVVNELVDNTVDHVTEHSLETTRDRGDSHLWSSHRQKSLDRPPKIALLNNWSGYQTSLGKSNNTDRLAPKVFISINDLTSLLDLSIHGSENAQNTGRVFHASGIDSQLLSDLFCEGDHSREWARITKTMENSNWINR